MSRRARSAKDRKAEEAEREEREREEKLAAEREAAITKKLLAEEADGKNRAHRRASPRPYEPYRPAG